MDLIGGDGRWGEGRDEGGRKSESEKKVVKMEGEKQVVRAERERGRKGRERVRRCKGGEGEGNRG